jgi:hypothetical protein
VVGPPPGGSPPSLPNVKKTGGIRLCIVALQDAAARHSCLFFPSRDRMASLVRMVNLLLPSSGMTMAPPIVGFRIS